MQIVRVGLLPCCSTQAHICSRSDCGFSQDVNLIVPKHRATQLGQSPGCSLLQSAALMQHELMISAHARASLAGVSQLPAGLTQLQHALYTILFVRTIRSAVMTVMAFLSSKNWIEDS